MKFIKDIISQLIGNGVLTITTQILVYPIIALYCGESEYGMVLTIMGIVNTLALSFGQSLNNVVLVIENNVDINYKKYNNILLYILPLSIISYLSVCIFQKISVNLIVLVTIIMTILNNYISVDYRIKLKYNKVMISNIIQVIGLVLGVSYVILMRNGWFYPFFLSQLFFLIYNLYNTNVINKSIQIKKGLNTKIIKTFTILLFTTLIGNLIIYMDRSLIYPILGAENVSIYTVASFFGKSLSIVLGPISGVMLSYLSNGKLEIHYKNFKKLLFLLILVGVFFSIISYFLAYPFTSLLYPDLAIKAKKIMFIANLAAIIASLCNVINPILLKKAPVKTQIVIQVCFLILYMGLGYVLIIRHGVMGFAIASTIANFLKFVFMIYLSSLNLKNKEV